MHNRNLFTYDYNTTIRSHYYKGYRTTNFNQTTEITLTMKITPLQHSFIFIAHV